MRYLQHKETAIELLSTRPLYNVDFKNAKDILNRAFEEEKKAEISEPFFYGHGDDFTKEITDLYWKSWSLHHLGSLKSAAIAVKSNDPVMTAIHLFLNRWEEAYEVLNRARKDVIKGRKPSANPRESKIRTIDNTGTCPVCGMNVKLSKNGGIVAHGYNLHFGFQNGNCEGVGCAPWEVSTSGKVAYIEKLNRYVNGVQEGTINEEMDDSKREHLVSIMTWDIGVHQKLVDGWKAQPLPGTK